MRIKGSILLSGVFIIIFGGMIVLSQGYPEKARLVPLVVAVPGLLMSLVQLIIELFFKDKIQSKEEDSKTHGYEAAAQEEVAYEEELTVEEIKKREAVMVGWILAILVLILAFGFWITIAAFLLIFLRIHGQETWKTTIAVTVGGWMTIYLIFQVILRIPLFEGFLFKLIG